jgi:hypothetical protein
MLPILFHKGNIQLATLSRKVPRLLYISSSWATSVNTNKKKLFYRTLKERLIRILSMNHFRFVQVS